MHQLPGWELDSWKAYHAVEPLPDLVLMIAQVCHLLYEANRDHKRSKPLSIEDFIPSIQPRKKRKMSVEQMLANFRSATAENK